ncbi:MAG: NUDIX domain-containing protein [Clostridiales bacterium]|nr:NUDIX domain-containing protein [Clostridiales bacterium]
MSDTYAVLSGCPKIDIVGANAYPTHSHIRTGCRGIVLKDNQLLLSHELNSGWYLIPGGGIEDGETPEACCIREVEEETGLIVEIIRPVLTMHEYYEDWLYISHYFLCRVVGEGRQALTAYEQQRGLVPEWMNAAKAVELFSHHQEYAASSEEKRGSYQREYTALQHFLATEERP